MREAFVHAATIPRTTAGDRSATLSAVIVIATSYARPGVDRTQDCAAHASRCTRLYRSIRRGWRNTTRFALRVVSVFDEPRRRHAVLWRDAHTHNSSVRRPIPSCSGYVSAFESTIHVIGNAFTATTATKTRHAPCELDRCSTLNTVAW